jgi:hypothetical protein
MMDWARVFLFFSVFYAAGLLITFGHLWRSSDYRQSHRRIAIYSLAWPAWWLVSHGLGALLTRSTTRLGERTEEGTSHLHPACSHLDIISVNTGPNVRAGFNAPPSS